MLTPVNIYNNNTHVLCIDTKIKAILELIIG